MDALAPLRWPAPLGIDHLVLPAKLNNAKRLFADVTGRNVTPVENVVEVRWLQALGEVLARSHLLRADELGPTVDSAVSRLGMQATIYVVDHEQVSLRPLPVPDRPTPAPVPVESSLPGRVYTRLQPSPGAGEANELWTPMINSTERLGVIRFDLPDDVDRHDTAWLQRCELLAGLTGHLVHAKMSHGDHLHQMRRSQPMAPAAELLWQLLPPLTSSSDDLIITAIVQPQYEVGGDGYDYAIDGSLARVVLVHALGRGLTGGMACGVALAAIRSARRAGAGLIEQARAADTALAEQFTTRRAGTVSAVLAELDIATGRLSYLNAGQPAPLLLRGTKLVGPLTGGRRIPLSRIDDAVAPAETVIEPGDRLLLYPDALTDSHAIDGTRLGVTRLVSLVEQCEAARLPAPETLRQLMCAMAAQSGRVDDAALLMLEWSAEAVRRVLPSPQPSPPGDVPAHRPSPQR